MSSQQKTLQPNQAQKKPPVRQPQHTSPQKVKAEQILEAPETLQSKDVLAAQQQLGNQVVQRALDEGQQREPSSDGKGNLHPEISDAIQQARSGGTPLPRDVQAEMSKKFKRKFSNVRLHTDSQADKLSRRIRARAFTIGSDIFFKNGVYAPATPAGRETLVHELTHVVQQDGTRTSGKLKLGGRGTAQEHEAEKISRGTSPVKTVSSRGAVQSQGEEEEIQTQGEEEEIQTQGEEEELQMQGEEEELQMQEDEEEIQTQPDAGVVQRIFGFGKDDDKKKKKMEISSPTLISSTNPDVQPSIPKAPPLPPTKGTVGDTLKTAMKPKEGIGSKIKSAFSKKPPSFEEELKSKAKKIGKTSEEATSKIDEKVSQKQLGYAKEDIQAPQKKKENENKIKLMNTIQDPNAKPEDIKSAQEQMKTLFGKKESKLASQNRATKLQNLAKGGDQDAYKKMQSEKEESAKNSKWGKFKGFMKEYGGKALGMAKEKLPGLLGGLVGGGVGKAKDHFMGPSKDKEEEGGDKKGGGTTVNVGTQGGGGGGGNAFNVMAEKYADEVQKNKELQNKINELEKKLQTSKV